MGDDLPNLPFCCKGERTFSSPLALSINSFNTDESVIELMLGNSSSCSCGLILFGTIGFALLSRFNCCVILWLCRCSLFFTTKQCRLICRWWFLGGLFLNLWFRLLSQARFVPQPVVVQASSQARFVPQPVVVQVALQVQFVPQSCRLLLLRFGLTFFIDRL